MSRAAPSRPPRAAGEGARPAAAWLGLLVVAAYAGVLGLGYFSDDYIFVDAVRRQAPGPLLLGWFGVWPWYRPLARELFFLVTGAAGPWAAPLAHAIAVATLWLGVVRLRAVLARRLGATAAGVGVLLFACHSLTMLHVAWLSGYQDLLAITLLAVALDLHQRGRSRAAVLAVAAATLAKEVGFVGFVLLPLETLLAERRRPAAREWRDGLFAAAGALAVHVLARATWPHRAQAAVAPEPYGRALAVLGDAFAPWTVPPGVAGPLAWLGAAGAGVAAFALLRPRRGAAAAPAPAAGGLAFLVAALAVTLLPVIVQPLVAGVPVQARHFVVALPWACALAGALLARFVPGPALGVAVPLACAACVWTSVPRAVDLDTPAAWQVRPLDWAEAQRVIARSHGLERDARTLLAARPESLVVGIVHVPYGSFFQTGDGPLLRVTLGDNTVRAFMADALAPARVADAAWPLVLLDYDAERTHGLVRLEPGDPAVLRQAVEAILDDNLPRARVLAAYAGRAGAGDPIPAYVAAVAEFAARGPLATFARTAAPHRVPADAGAGIAAAFAPALAAPADAAAHARAADALAAAHAPVLEALERFLAVRIDSTRAGDALQLGRLLARPMPAVARRAFALAARPGAPAAVAANAKAAAAALADTP